MGNEQDVPTNLHQALGRSDRFVNDKHSFQAGMDTMIEQLPVGEILDRRIEAIEKAIRDANRAVEQAREAQLNARSREGNAIRLRGRLGMLLHRTVEARKAIGDA